MNTAFSVRDYELLGEPKFDGYREEMRARARVSVAPEGHERSLGALVDITWMPGDFGCHVEPVGLENDHGTVVCQVPDAITRVLRVWARMDLDLVMSFDCELSRLREERLEEMAS